LDTERKFSSARLVEIAQQRAPGWYGSDRDSNRGGGSASFGINGESSEACFSSSGGAPRGRACGGSSPHLDVDPGVAAARVADLLRRVAVLAVDESGDLLVQEWGVGRGPGR
jgi:hypothetical protein